MNFDPAEEEHEAEQDKSLVLMYAGACAYLQACYKETQALEVADAFTAIWDRAVMIASPVEFYLTVKRATETLGYK